jgi:hypothetical protein
MAFVQVLPMLNFFRYRLGDTPDVEDRIAPVWGRP